MKKVIYLVSLALIAIVIAACSSPKRNSPEGAVNAYMKAMQKNDSRAALELFHFSKDLTDEEFDQYVDMVNDKVVKQNEKKQGIASWEFGEVEMAEDGQSAVVNYTIKYGDGTEQKDKQKTVLVDGKWMLDSGK